MRFVLVLALGLTSVLGAALKDSKNEEKLTNSLIALKSNPPDESAERPKRSESSKLNESNDDISGAAMVLARYIETTGDLDGVVDFLRSMVSSGKLPEEDGMSYIAEVLSSLQTLKASYNHQEMDPAQALRHFIQVGNEMRDAPRDAIKDEQHQDKISKINLEEENLNKSKQDIERKIKNLEQEKYEEEDLLKKKQLINNLMKQVEEGEKDNETILTINKLLEEQKNENKISKHLYTHVKEALIQTAVENVSRLTTSERN